MIHRHFGEISGAGRLAPRGKDERTSDNKVDEPVCPPPSTMRGQTDDEIVASFARAGTDRLVNVRRYRGMSTPIGNMTRNATPTRTAWSLTFFSYSVRDIVTAFTRSLEGGGERGKDWAWCA
jgi:hypothetical protein